MSQRIMVKSIVTKPTKKEGTNITTVEDEKGAKMSAFNDAALEKVHAGDVLEVDVELKGNYINITAWKLIESKPQPVPEAPKPIPSPTDWAEKDRITRLSIEQQVAFKGFCELMVAKVIPTEHPMAIKALSWALGKLGADFDTLFPAPQPSKPVTATPAKSALFPAETGTPEPSRPASEPAGASVGTVDEIGPDDHAAWVQELRAVWKKLGWPTPKIREWFTTQTGKQETKELTLDELKRVVSLANDELAVKKGAKL